MWRIIYHYLPGFRTKYFVVIDDPTNPASLYKVGVRLPGPHYCVPGYVYVRVKYFNFFGTPLFKKTQRLDLTSR